MAFASQKYGTYRSKPWEFWGKSMGVTLRFRYNGISEIRIRFARQRTMVIRQLLVVLWSCRLVVCEAIAKLLKAHDS